MSLGIGDWVYFRCMGAYTLAAGSTFNGMPRPGTVHVCGEIAARSLTRGNLLQHLRYNNMQYKYLHT